MDKLDRYRQIIEKTLQAYAEIPYAYGDMSSHTVFDRENDSYLLMTVGWDGERRIHGCLVHLDIINEKIWIQRDGTEDGIANELVDAGIPKNEIVLAFHHPEIRQHTDFAFA